MIFFHIQVSVCMLVYMYHYLYILKHQSKWDFFQFRCLSVCISECQYVSVSVCIYQCLYISVSVCISVCMYQCQYVSVSVCMCVSVYISECVCLCFFLVVYNKAQVQRISNREFKLWTFLQGLATFLVEKCVISHQSRNIVQNLTANHHTFPFITKWTFIHA